jgi:hypothetical protein
MKTIRQFAPLLLAGLCFLPLFVRGQTGGPFAILATTLDAGGGVSRGGRFAVNGTIGQTDAGALGGGRFKIEGGFWNRFTMVQAPGAPELKIKRLASGQVILIWPVDFDGYVLEYTDAVSSGVWTAETGPIVDTATDHTLVLAPVGNRCYRLKKSMH